VRRGDPDADQLPKHFGGEAVSLRSTRSTGDVTRIETQIEASGELKVSDNGKLRPLKMSVNGKAVYDEQLLTIEAGERLERTALRYYETAEAQIGIEKGISKPKLREDRRMISANISSNDGALFSPLGSLTREELELIDIPGNSLLVDDLLPEKPVALGDKWQHSDQLLARLMGLDAVSQSDVYSELKGLDDAAAKIEFAGTIQGALAGVASDLEIKGRYPLRPPTEPRHLARSGHPRKAVRRIRRAGRRCRRSHPNENHARRRRRQTERRCGCAGAATASLAGSRIRLLIGAIEIALRPPLVRYERSARQRRYASGRPRRTGRPV